MSGIRWLTLLALGPVILACGSDVTVQRVASYAPHGTTLSVLGVFKNGRMDPGAWNEWAPTIVAAVGDETCTAAFDDRMEKAAPALFTELDEQTRQDGITDELLDRAASNARGGAILVVEVFGGVSPVKKPGNEAPAPAAPPPSTMRGQGRGRRRSMAPSAAPPRQSHDQLDVSVGVYSLHEHQVMASVEMHADAGGSSDELRAFSDKIRAMLHGAKCAGWAWQDEAKPR